MNEEEPPFYAPNQPAPKPRTPNHGVVWTVTKGDRSIRCELRDDTRVDAGVDCQILEGDWLVFAQRFPTAPGAEFMAASIRRDYLRDG